MLHYTSYKALQLHNDVFITECSKRVINKCQVKFHYSNLNITHKQYTGKFTSSWGRKTASSCSRAAWEGGTDKERPGAGGRTARAWSWGESDGENGLFPVGNVRRLAVFTYLLKTHYDPFTMLIATVHQMLWICWKEKFAETKFNGDVFC